MGRVGNGEGSPPPAAASPQLGEQDTLSPPREEARCPAAYVDSLRGREDKRQVADGPWEMGEGDT